MVDRQRDRWRDGQTDKTDKQTAHTDMTKSIVAFRNPAKSPKN
jgi:hypothetical protein